MIGRHGGEGVSEDLPVRRVHATDAARIRALRLEALDDPAAPMAFLETRAHAESLPDDFWTERAIGAALSDRAGQFVADAGARWVGTVTVLRPEAGSSDHLDRPADGRRALLVGVYVSPDHRGSGLLARLVDEAARWAHERGSEELALDVHEDNAQAQAAYARLGFVATGRVSPSQTGLEREMVRPLG